MADIKRTTVVKPKSWQAIAFTTSGNAVVLKQDTDTIVFPVSDIVAVLRAILEVS